MTLVTRGSEEVVDQIIKQLNKLIDVVKLIDLADSPHIERELLMVKIKTSEKTRNDIRSMVDIFRGRILDVTPSSYVIEVTGASGKLEAFVAALDPNSIIEVVRSGATGISRGELGLHL
jgi:acetolactate synthase I/III small subunit